MYCIVHGSYRQHLDLINQVADLFRLAGLTVVCPPRFLYTPAGDDFVRFSPLEADAAKTEQALLKQMEAINDHGFSYFVNPDGTLGASASYELAHARHLGLPVFFFREATGLPLAAASTSVWQPYELAAYILQHGRLP